MANERFEIGEILDNLSTGAKFRAEVVEWVKANTSDFDELDERINDLETENGLLEKRVKELEDAQEA